MKINKKITYLMATIGLVVSLSAVAEINHNMTNHTQSTTLTEAGTDIFATIQEAIVALNANPNTDWKRVNLEKLRQHLIEMQDMTLNIEVVQQPIKNGFQAVLTPTTKRAKRSLVKVLSAHPKQMNIETGWDMQVVTNNDTFTLTLTTQNPSEIDKLRGLGYIGIMAYGKHHQPHHWAMASGENPHAEH